MSLKTVESQVFPLKIVLNAKYTVDFFQREYVWTKKHMEDLISDLSLEFLRQWNQEHILSEVEKYDPYYMGEIVLAKKEDVNFSIIDGQQRITSLTLLLIYMKHTFGELENFPNEIDGLIYSNHYGEYKFNLNILDRRECMLGLYMKGCYDVKVSDTSSVHHLVERYSEIKDIWNDNIDNHNAVAFAYWLMEKVCFSKVWTNNDEFAYVIFETMNDRGLSLTQVEMLRSYLLAKIDEENDLRNKAMKKFDQAIRNLIDIKLSSKSKAEFEFFKVYLRTHYAEDMTQGKSDSDFVRIGKEFHRWIRDNSTLLKLENSNNFFDFVNQIEYFVYVYRKIYSLMASRNTSEYLYLIVNDDYGFTLQPALIMASVKYMDSDDIIERKIKIVSKYLTKLLSWRVWNQNIISQSALEADIYKLAKEIRNINIMDLQSHLENNPIDLPDLTNTPILNQQNKQKIKVLLALITEIVAVNSGAPDYMLNKKDIEIEHIWADAYEEHKDEFSEEGQFLNRRNTIGDLLLLPKSFNASYGKEPYSAKVKHYIEHNILAQSLSADKYEKNPGFLKFKESSKLAFKPYDDFKDNNITERTNLYRGILIWNWK